MSANDDKRNMVGSGEDFVEAGCGRSLIGGYEQLVAEVNQQGMGIMLDPEAMARIRLLM